MAGALLRLNAGGSFPAGFEEFAFGVVFEEFGFTCRRVLEFAFSMILRMRLNDDGERLEVFGLADRS